MKTLWYKFLVNSNTIINGKPHFSHGMHLEMTRAQALELIATLANQITRDGESVIVPLLGELSEEQTQ